MASRIRTAIVYLWCLLQVNYGWTQPRKTAQSIFVQSKNYFLLTLLEKDKNVRRLLEYDPVLSQLVMDKQKQIVAALPKNDFHLLVKAILFSRQECDTISYHLSHLYDVSHSLQRLVKEQLAPSGCYSLYNKLSYKDQLLKAFELDANGINWTIAVYGSGQKPHYPDIDSISFNVNTLRYSDMVKLTVKGALSNTTGNKLFFELPMQCALAFLYANERMDAAAYEPMSKTVNKLAFQKALLTNWTNYAYSTLLVPGEGPEQHGVAIDPIGKQRCRLAAQIFGQSLAPFIIVSGGKVHPYKTAYCEAEQMKKYLIDSLKVPEYAIIMEPHARHTTTNIRNGVRLMIRYGFPAGKPGLIVTDKDDNDYITTMEKRCMNELGYIPYKLGKRVNDTGLEFFPVKGDLQINSTEPLDP